jgi:hypothetical protein
MRSPCGVSAAVVTAAFGATTRDLAADSENENDENEGGD